MAFTKYPFFCVILAKNWYLFYSRKIKSRDLMKMRLFTWRTRSFKFSLLGIKMRFRTVNGSKVGGGRESYVLCFVRPSFPKMARRLLWSAKEQTSLRRAHSANRTVLPGILFIRRCDMALMIPPGNSRIFWYTFPISYTTINIRPFLLFIKALAMP